MTETIASPPSAEDTVYAIPVGAIDESPTNPRKVWNAIEELGAQIAANGLLQPVLVRPKPDGRYELVIGSRRFRAVKHAGLATISARVKPLDDVEVINAQIVENARREDVHPLEEADGYKTARELGQTVDEIAARVAGTKTPKSTSHIYARLKLCKLGPEGRKLFLAGRIYESTALALARIADPERQAKAAKELESQHYDSDAPLSARRAEDHLQRNYYRELKGAPFKLDDALLHFNGACTTCPHRLGNDPSYTAEMGRADVCTQPSCYYEKAAVVLERLQAKKPQAKILSVVDSKSIFGSWEGSGLNSGSAYVDLDEKADSDPQRRTWKKLLGEHTPTVHLAMHPFTGQPWELVKKAELGPALKAAGHTFGVRGQPSEAEKKRRKEERERGAHDAAVYRRAIRQVVEKIERIIGPHCNGNTAALWDLLIRMAGSGYWIDERPIRRSRGIAKDVSLEDHVEGLTETARAGYAFELLIVQKAHLSSGLFEDVCRAFHVDVKGIDEQVKREEQAAAAASPKAKAKAKPVAPSQPTQATSRPQPAPKAASPTPATRTVPAKAATPATKHATAAAAKSVTAKSAKAATPATKKHAAAAAAKASPPKAKGATSAAKGAKGKPAKKKAAK